MERNTTFEGKVQDLDFLWNHVMILASIWEPLAKGFCDLPFYMLKELGQGFLQYFSTWGFLILLNALLFQSI